MPIDSGHQNDKAKYARVYISPERHIALCELAEDDNRGIGRQCEWLIDQEHRRRAAVKSQDANRNAPDDSNPTV